MSDVKVAIDAVLRAEDSTLAGKVVDLHDGAGLTRFGLTSKNHPELVPIGFFDPARVDRDAALIIAEGSYTRQYANPLHIAEIRDQALAQAVLSAGVNMGIHEAIKLLQKAINDPMEKIQVDGCLGPSTLQAVNAEGSKLLKLFAFQAREYYTDIAEEHPEDAKFLRGWDRRVSAWMA